MDKQKLLRILQPASALVLTAAIVISCLFLPTALAESSAGRRMAADVPLYEEPPMEFHTNRMQLSYPRRLWALTTETLIYQQMDFDALAERYYGYRDLYLAFLSQLWALVRQGAVTEAMYYTFTQFPIEPAYYYVSEPDNGGGFFMAELTANLSDNQVTMWMDLDSGLLVYLCCSGPLFDMADGEADTSVPDQVLTDYAAYLDLTVTGALEATGDTVRVVCDTQEKYTCYLELRREPLPGAEGGCRFVLSLYGMDIPQK